MIVRKRSLIIAWAIALITQIVPAANANPLTTDYESLVEEAISVFRARREIWVGRYPDYRVDQDMLLQDGVYQMELRAEADRALQFTGPIVTIEAQLIGIYDPTARTFTWGWATDEFPALERAAALATRAHGETHSIQELTTPVLQERGETRLRVVGHSEIITALIGNLAWTATQHEDFSTNRLIIIGLPDFGMMQ